ncbi:class I SAM-dependent methyltransferase [Candidatus Woesearchaeota archaeon]|nr:class I SAM-dependent methyltransferase [Candidatus Woesearchaeota archaeon]
MGTGFYQSYDRMIRQACPDYDYCLNLIAENIPSNIISVLDLGSGTGNLAQYILKIRSGIKICGIELQQTLVEIASKKITSPNVSFIQGDILKLDWPNAECVTSSLTIHHFTQKQKEDVFRKVYHSSRCFLYFDRLKGSSKAEEKQNLEFLFNHMRKAGLSEETIREAKTEMEKNDKPLTVRQLNRLLKSVGFDYEVLYLKNGFAVYSCTKKE